MRVAGDAGVAGATYPTVLSAADEVAVAAFLEGSIPFPAIPEIIEDVVQNHRPETHVSVDGILAADTWARQHAESLVSRRSA